VISAPQSSAVGHSLIWYLHLDPRPSDVTDKKTTGVPHNRMQRGEGREPAPLAYQVKRFVNKSLTRSVKDGSLFAGAV